MDLLAIILGAAVIALVLWASLGRGASARRGDRIAPLGRRSADRAAADREALEAEDLEQLLAVNNAWRRRRGQPERTLADVKRLLATPPGRRSA